MFARTNRRISFSLVLAALLPLLVACGGDDSSEPEPEATALPVSEILTRASQRLAGTQTVRFGLEIQGDTYVDTSRTIQLLDARGELVRPDRVRTDFKVKVLRGVTVSTSLIIVGDQRWSTDLITGEWGPAPEEFGYDPTVLFDNQGGIGPVMDRIENPEQLPNEDIRGKSTYHIRAIVDQTVIDLVTAGTMTGSPVTVDLWIDTSTFDLLRARLSEPNTVTDRAPASWTLDLSSQGAALTVEPPQ